MIHKIKLFQFSLTGVIFLSLFGNAFSKNDSAEINLRRTHLGVSGQIYPAGLISTVNLEYFWSEHTSVLIRFGGNFTNRKDYSEYNDNETGSGIGATLGIRKRIPLLKGNFIAGLHTDFWNMWIDWKNMQGELTESTGQSYTLVIQPWIEAGYMLNPKNSHLHLGFSAGFGREINVITEGKNVAEGWMISALLHFQYEFNSPKD